MSIYLKLDGIDGSVTTKGFEKWIELREFSLGTRTHYSMRVGREDNRTNQIPEVDELNAVKKVDKASPYLLEASLAAKVFPQALIRVVDADKNNQHYLQYTLHDAIISNCDTHVVNAGVNHAATEGIAFSFIKIEMQFVPRSASNQFASPISTGYDLAEAKTM